MARSKGAQLSVSGEVWAQVLARRHEDIPQFMLREGVTIDNFETLHQSLLRGQTKYHAKKTNTILRRLEPVVKKLQGFSRAITVFTQCDPTISSLVWGGLLLCLECISRISSVSQLVCTALHAITNAMPRFDHYSDLFAADHRPLQAALASVYAAYLDFCISVRRFYRRSILYHAFRYFWSDTENQLTHFVQDMQACSKDFEKEARMADTIRQDAHRRRVENALPMLANTSRTPTDSFSVPAPRTKEFFGRELELKNMSDILRNSDKQQHICAIEGIGGVGKTAIALEYCYRYANAHAYVFWLNAEHETLLVQDFCKIGSDLGLYPTTEAAMVHPSQLVSRIHAWLQKNHGWLLIFDNAEQSSLLKQYLPRCEHGAVIITTQKTALAKEATTAIRLGPLTAGQGADFLLKLTSITPDAQNHRLAHQLSDEVGHSPFSLKLLAGYIEQSRLPLDEATEALLSSRANSLRMFAGVQRHDTHTGDGKTALTMHAASLSELPTHARNTINVMAMLYSESIPETILREDVIAYKDKRDFVHEVRTPLQARNLVELSGPLNEPTMSIHRNAQLSILWALDTDLVSRQNTFSQALAILLRHVPKHSPIMVPEPSRWPKMRQYLPHVLSLHKVFQQSSPPIASSIDFAALLCDAASYLYEMNFSGPGMEILRTAISICEDQLRTTSPQESGEVMSSLGLSESLNTLFANILAYAAGIHGATGDLPHRKEAREWSERIVTLRLRALDPLGINAVGSHELYLLSANAYNDFGLQLLNEEHYEQAESYCKRSLQMKESLKSVCKVPAFELAISYAYLGIVRLARNDYKAAIELCELAVAEAEDQLDQLLFQYFLAMALSNAGRDMESLALHTQVLQQRVLLLGDTNYFTLYSFFATAQCQRKVHMLEEARENLITCIDNSEAAQWSDACQARARFELSLLLDQLGETEPATLLLSEARQLRQALLTKHTNLSTERLLADGVSEMALFDHLVNVDASRTTFGELARYINAA